MIFSVPGKLFGNILIENTKGTRAEDMRGREGIKRKLIENYTERRKDLFVALMDANSAYYKVKSVERI